MNTSIRNSLAPFSTDLTELNGRIVIVKSNRDHGNPSTAMRGWIEVSSEKGVGDAGVAVVVEFPQMFSTRAHHRTFLLDETALARLLASERDGVFEFTIDGDLV